MALCIVTHLKISCCKRFTRYCNYNGNGFLKSNRIFERVLKEFIFNDKILKLSDNKIQKLQVIRCLKFYCSCKIILLICRCYITYYNKSFRRNLGARRWTPQTYYRIFLLTNICKFISYQARLLTQLRLKQRITIELLNNELLLN